MPVNFNQLQPIQGSQVLGQLAPSAPQDDGLGGFFEGLQGLVGGLKGLAGGSSGPQASVNPSYSPQSPAQSLSTGLSQGPQSISNNPSLQNMVQNTGVFQNAMKMLGVQEGQSALSAYLTKANPNLDPTKTPWCAGFVGSVLNSSGLKGTGSLMAKSYLNYGQPVSTPSQGDIVVLNRGNDPRFGHVGFVESLDLKKGMVNVLGGNQSNGVNIKSFPINQVAGYRHPPTGDDVQRFAQNNNISSPNELANIPQKNQYVQYAIRGASQVYKDNPVMSDVAAAQAILESNLADKPSGLAKQNNFFGIKGNGTAGTVNMRTKEYGSKGYYSTNAGFAKNASPEDSFVQHRNLMQKPRYQDVRNAKTFEEAAQALQKSGYATDPSYAKKLIQIRNKYLKTSAISDPNQYNDPNQINPPVIPHDVYEDMARQLDQGRDSYAMNGPRFIPNDPNNKNAGGRWDLPNSSMLNANPQNWNQPGSMSNMPSINDTYGSQDPNSVYAQNTGPIPNIRAFNPNIPIRDLSPAEIAAIMRNLHGENEQQQPLASPMSRLAALSQSGINWDILNNQDRRG